MGATHFLTKGLESVKTEMSLHVLAYNLKRLLAILGMDKIIEAMRATALFLTLQRVVWALAILVTSQGAGTIRSLYRPVGSFQTSP